MGDDLTGKELNRKEIKRSYEEYVLLIRISNTPSTFAAMSILWTSI